MFFTIKSTPIVEFIASGNSADPNRRIKLDFPTLVSPTTTILNLKSLHNNYISVDFIVIIYNIYNNRHFHVLFPLKK